MNARNCSSALTIALALALSGAPTAINIAKATGGTDQDSMMLETAGDILSLEAQFTNSEMIAGLLGCSSNCFQHNHNHNHNHNGSHNNNNNNNNHHHNHNNNEKLADASVQIGEACFLV